MASPEAREALHAEGWPESCPTCKRAFSAPAGPEERGEGLREAEAWHRALNDDPLLPNCSGTHMMGYGYCQRLAALAATPAPDERLRAALGWALRNDGGEESDRG